MSPKEYERLFARILIAIEGGDTVAYAYNRESIEQLGLDVSQGEKSTFIEVGNILTLGEDNYEVLSVNFKLYKDLYEMTPKYGINMYGMTEPTDYNCQIGVFVKRV